MIYQFKTADGRVLEGEFAMGAAPSLGEPHVIDGEDCVRICSNHQTNAQRNVTGFASQVIHPDLAREYGHKEFDELGSPVFKGRKEAEDLADRSDGEIHYDAMPTKSETAGRVPAKELARLRGLR